jgi:MGT family glycosyltransferase
VQDIGEILAEWQPDVVVCDPTMWAPFLIFSETRSVPVCVFSLIPACFVSGSRGPIPGFPIPPPRTPAGRMRASVLRWLSDTARSGIRAEASAIRARFGLSPLECSVTDFAARMPLYLVPGTPDFDYHRDDLPPSVRYVGPCLWPGRRDENLPGWIGTIGTDQPWVYASEGTVHLEPRVLRAVAQGLAGEPVQVIITTGKHRDPASLDLGIPQDTPNIHVQQWVPIQPLLPKLSGIVTVGGPSTLLAGLWQGIPAVIVPFHWDHPETACRLQASGAGIHIRPGQCNAKNMKRAVMDLLTNPGYRNNAQRLAKSFRDYGGAPRAAELIEGLALRSASACGLAAR